MAKITKHAEKRGRKRLGIPKKSVTRIANRASVFGVHKNETKNSLRRFLDGAEKIHNENAADNVRIYHRNVFVFDGDVLVTIMPLPRKWHGVADAMEKKQNK